MIAIAPECRRVKVSKKVAEDFEAMLPSIQRVAAFGFRRAPYWLRQELIHEAIAKAYAAFTELVARGKAALAYPTVLVNYAVRQVRAGRKLGCRQNVRDVMSPYAQRRKRFSVRPITERDVHDEWEELTVDRKANPADVAACRVDFRDWLGRLRRFKRQVALRLAQGDSTSEAARYFRLSPARISQLRRELLASWNEFQAIPARV
jgi:hypothetical protein